jgi:hypothetical protein
MKDESNTIQLLIKIKALFSSLSEILNLEGDSSINYAKNTLIDNIERIEYALGNIDSDKIDTCLLFNEVKDSYKSMYPPHGGLTEFFIWRDDFDERVRANRPLDRIKEELRLILEI